MGDDVIMVKAKIINNIPYCSKCGGELSNCKSVELIKNRMQFKKVCKECKQTNYYYADIVIGKETKRY